MAPSTISSPTYDFRLKGPQLRGLPKVDLHRHLDCSMRWSTVLELAPQVGLELPKTLREIQEGFLVLEPLRDLDSVLKKFMNAQKLLASDEILQRLAEEAVEDAVNEGVRLLELRFAPTFIQEGHSSLHFKKILQALTKGLESAQKKWPISVGLICIFQRNLPSARNAEVLKFLLENQDFFCGADLADLETAAPPRYFKNLFQEVSKAGIPITIHSGEMPHAEASLWVRESVEILGARRIGHGVQVIHDLSTIDFLKINNICLEICPLSNLLTGAFSSPENHPLRKLFDAGLRVCINSDDPGIFHSSLLDDYRMAREAHQFSDEELRKMNQFGYEASFLKNKEKWRKDFWP